MTERLRPPRRALAAGPLGLLAFAGGVAGPATAQGAPASPSALSAPSPSAAAPAPAAPAAPSAGALPSQAAPSGEAQGVVVVAAGDASDETWPLAGAVYRDASLRPKGLRDETARVLAGEAPPQGAPAPLRELSELRSAVRGDDAASRSVLVTLGQRAGASLVLVVFAPQGAAVSARPFDPRAGRFEAWSLVPDSLAPPASRWASAPGELRRRYGAPPAAAAAAGPSPARAPQKAAPAAEKPRHFWSSPWFWGALGVAAALAGAVVLATRASNNDPSTNPQVDIRVDKLGRASGARGGASGAAI